MGSTSTQGDCSFSNTSDPRIVGLTDAVRAGWYRQETNELLQGFPISAADTVLDVGCGAGMATLFAVNRSANVIFADVDEATVNALATKLTTLKAKDWRGLVTDCDPIPLESEMATRVIAMEVLEHVADPAVIMKEFARVAAPGALLLFAVPDAGSEELQRSVAPDFYFQYPNHIQVFTDKEFGGIVTDAGLKIIRRHSYNFFWNIGLALLWLSESGTNTSDSKLGTPATSMLEPPFPPMLETWAQLWQMVLDHPMGESLRDYLNRKMPKSQIIIAQKPAK